MTNRRAILTLSIAVLLAWIAPPAHADELRSEGTVLHGKVDRLTSTGVVFSPKYGEGSVAIKWKNIEDIRTEPIFQVLYDDDLEAYSPLVGYHDGKLQLRDAAIDPATISIGLPLKGTEPSFVDRLRSGFRYWDGNFDVAVNVTQSTIDSTGVAVAFGAARTKGPSRFTTIASYRFSSQKSKDSAGNSDEQTIQNEWKGLLRYEHDIIPVIYLFGSADATYDEVQSLAVRAVPKLGAGYTIWQEDVTETKKNFVRVEAGGAYVYEKYFKPPVGPGGDSNDYFSVALGALARYHLPFGVIDWRFDYLPSVSDWANDYLLRTEFALVVPMFGPMAVKFALIDEFDNIPAPDADKNSLYLTLGLSVLW